MSEIVVEISALAPGGDAVGRQQGGQGDDGSAAADGRVTFVPLAAPGERVRARLQREKGRVAWAELVAIERPGAERVPPPCPLFGACGGCQWQHVTAAAQQAAKAAIVARALGLPAAPVAAPSPPFGYRDRARLTAGAGGALGFHARRSHQVIDVPACPLLGPELARALPAVRAVVRGLAPGSDVDLQAGREGVHVNVDARSPAGGRAPWTAPDDALAALQAAGVVGLAVRGQSVWGRAAVDIAEPGTPPLEIPAGGFAQVGRAANAALVRAVMSAVGPAPGVVQELYAGSGNFTRHLLAAAEAAHASDASADAVARGRRTAPGAAWAVRPQAVAADTVVLDPPREGADAVALGIARAARRRVVYVSCDPQTLARDAGRLRDAGFRLTDALALDLMPQTYHVEVVATFDRG